ncbi:Flagellar hook-associated protein FliD [Polaromonas sp. CG9_12]|nr:Flagellar hook-associated protein FliD [Polaromonas sp. CG9_12]
MAAVSSLGIGSGLDLNNLLAGLKSAEQVPLAAIQTRQTSYTSKLSAYGQLNSALSTLQTAAAALAKPALFQGVTANSTATDVVTAKALSTASSGNYAINVTQLSQAQSLAVAGVASTTTAIGGGTVTIEFGTISGGSLDPATGKYTGAAFTTDATRPAASVVIDPAASSLADIAKAINAKSADLGVTASIVNDGSATPNRLVLTSRLTGETSSMKVTVSGEALGSRGLSALLTNDPANPATPAQAQSLKAAGVADTTTAIGLGEPATVTLDFGTISGGTLDPATGKYSGASFTADGTRLAKTITIDSSNNSLQGIRDAINGGDMGVTASIVDDGSGTANRLVLTSNQTGETSSMRIVVDGDPDVSSLLSNNPAGTQNLTQTTAAKNTVQQLQQTVTAQNTRLTVNGIAITSATNSVEGAVQDVTMTVAKVGTSSLKVQKDIDSAGNAIATFVNAFNSLQSVAKKLTAFDATSKSGAVLLGDSTLRNIQVGIRSALTSAQDDDGSGLTMLSQIGVSFQKDGTLALDSTKLKAALDSKMSGVANLFAGAASGYGTKMAALITGYTDTTGGVLTAATKGINTTLDMLAKQYTATSARVESTVARYKAQFTALDVMMSQMNQTSSYLTAQFEALNNSNKK